MAKRRKKRIIRPHAKSIRLCEVKDMFGMTRQTVLNKESKGLITVYRPSKGMSLVFVDDMVEMIKKSGVA